MEPTATLPATVATSPPVASSVSGSLGGEHDGRRLRRERNRQRVVKALLDLYQEGNLRPSTGEVAERAGLSPRSLFRYFDDVDDLIRAAVEGELERAAPLLPLTACATDPFAVRVAALVEQRFRLFDTVAPAATVSRLRSPFQPVLQSELRRNRAYLRDQVRGLFAPELGALGSEVAAETLAACDIATSFEAHQLLLHDQNLSPGRARGAMARSIMAILRSGPEPTAGPVSWATTVG